LALEGATNFIRYQVNSNQKTVKQLPKDATDSEREALLGSIKFFDDTLSLIKILETLPSKEAVDLRDGLNKSAQYLLTELGVLLKNYGLYMPRDLEKMEWWDGQTGAAFKAYGAVDQASLLLGLRHQFELIKKLVQKAGPIIDYLKSHVADTENLDHALIDKWDTIVTAVKAKEKNQGSSLTDLEKFITQDMNSITFINMADKIPLSDIVGTSHDYFVQARKNIQKALLSRAEILSRTNSVKAYNCIAAFFNKNMAGKFPFADQKTTADDLSLETLWDFFALFDEKGGTPEKILANVQEVPGFDDQMQFLQTMYEIRQLFDSWVQGKSEAKDPLFDVEIEFRVNRQSEQNGHYVYHLWFNPTSTEQLKNISGGPLTGTWRYGEPMTLGLGWASPDRSAPVPIADANRPYMSVDRLRVEMTFGGNWALFALLRALQTSDTDVKRYLRLTVPQSNGMSTVIYHRLAVMKPAKNSKNPKREYLKIPVFPFSAPDLPCMKEYLGEAVLLEKRLNCVSSKDDPACKKFAQDNDARTIACTPEKKKQTEMEEPAA
jgi:type VI secretion system protein ImpL